MSVLRYGLLLQENSYDISRLSISQKKCIWGICCKPPLTLCKQLFDELKVLTLPSLLCILKKSKFVKTNFDQFAQLGNVCNSTLDIPKKLIQSKIMSELRNRNCCCMAKKIFNIIPKDVKKCHKIICECALKT